MDTFTRDDLAELLADRGDFRVSIYTPTHRTWPQSKPDRIRFDNQVQDTQDALVRLGMRPAEARDALSPAAQLGRDEAFWHEQADGLAVFVGRGSLRRYRLPVPFEPMAVIGNRHAIRQLLPLVCDESRFFVLALSQQDVRLIRCTRDTAADLPLPAHPRTVAEATGFDKPERGFSSHGGTPSGAGGRPARMIHTIGARADDDKEDILEYCEQIDRRLHPLLNDQDAPLVLAGVEFVARIYRKANTYPHLLAADVTGSPARQSADELRRRAWPLVEGELEKEREKSLARYRQSIGTGTASGDLRVVLRAAHEGQVGDLFVPARGPVWGRFYPATGSVEIHDEQQDGDEDLLDAAAAYTLSHRGRVHVLPQDRMPDGARAAAIFRYEFVT